MDVRQALEQVVEEVYGRAPAADDDIFSLGGSSLQALELVSRFEVTLGSPVDVERVITADTISGLVDELAAEALATAPE